MDVPIEKLQHILGRLGENEKNSICSAKLQNTGPLIYIPITIVSIVISFVLQKTLTHVNEVDQSGPVFCSSQCCRYYRNLFDI